MKHVYTRFFSVTILLLFFTTYSQFSHAQCSVGAPGTTAYDTTISFPSGATSIPVKFPQFDPTTGMVTCVRLCATITGVIDTMAIQNFAGSPLAGTFDYIRTDQLSGPGLSPDLSNSISTSIPFSLTAYDGTPNAGTDFYSQSKDTILNEDMCRTISDSVSIVQFYGLDSVTYNYDIDVTSTLVAAGSYGSLILTSAFVNFHFEYCTCPPAILPLNISQFNVTKLTADKAELKWSGYDEPFTNYYYEAEVSRDGVHFIPIGALPKNNSGTDPYRIPYRAVNGESGTFYFRVKQVYPGGYSRYSNIKQVNLENSDFPGFTIYPNPSDGIVGIKFDNTSTGRYNIHIYNAQGQTMVKKDIAVAESSYVQLASLKTGVYWIKLTDVKSQLTRVNQLLIK